MAIPLTGQITLAQIRTELDGSAAGALVSLQSASTGGYKVIQSSTAYAPDQIAPHAMSEFRGYTQGAADTTAPSIPGYILADNGSGPSDIYVFWASSTDNVAVTGYNLQRKTGSGGTYGSIYTGPNTYFTTTGVSGANYYFKVRAYDGAGNYSGFSSEVVFTITPACFVEGTMITLANGDKCKVEELQTTDLLLLSGKIMTLQDDNHTSTLYKWKSRFLALEDTASKIIIYKEVDATLTYIINDGLLEATEFHTQLVLRGGFWTFVPFKKIRLNDKLKHRNGSLVEVYKIEICNKPKKVYLLTLGTEHTYYANDILTHNIK